MPKFFVVSDVHGFYDEMKTALDEAGFDPNNEDHWLVGCGDYFDRGTQPLEVMQYLMGLPRKVLVKGNHEQLFKDCCERGVPYANDYYNGTADTILTLGDPGPFNWTRSFEECCNKALARTSMFLDSMVDYFETKNYIFVHSFVPIECDDTLPPYYIRNRKYSKMDDWRNANALKWEDARWGNPFDLAEKGLLPDKTLVFGHWHCSTGWAKQEGRSEFGKDAKCDPYYGDGFIAIDSCCAHSGKINCVVIEDEVM